jgi:hypothetical protein
MAERPVRRRPGPGGGGPRLAVIEGFAGRRSAIPFALLILGVLAIGLVALLMLNTAMDRNSVRIGQAQQRQAALTDREQALSQQLAGLSAPSALASRAAALGLVPNPQPAFIDPGSGKLLGSPSPAPTPSPSPTPTPTPTPTGTATPSVTATPTGTASASATPTGTATVTPAGTAGVTAGQAPAGGASPNVQAASRPPLAPASPTTPTDGSPR